MNQLLNKQLVELYGNNIPQDLLPILSKIDITYSNFQNEIDSYKKISNSNPTELSLIHQQLLQDANNQNQIITNLKRAIVALEPNSPILNSEDSAIDEASYLTESLIKLIDAQKKAQTELIQKHTELQILNSQLSEEKAKDDAILFAIGDGLVVTNTKGIIVLVNPAFEKLLGWNSSEVINRNMYEIVIKKDKYNNNIANEERFHFMAIASSKHYSSPPDTTYYYVRKDGSQFPVSISVSPIIINGNTIGAVEVFKDITKEKEIEKAKNEFVSVASHQLRTPLSSVNWYTEMLIESKLEGDKAENLSYLQEVEKAIARMTSMINDLLNISRLELGTFSVEPEIVDILDLTKTIINELKPKIIEKGHKIIGNYDTRTPNINTDPKLISMVIQNLLSNAIKYSPQQGEIIFSAGVTQDTKNLIVSIKDSGYGIPDKDKDKIFSKLFRASNIMKVDTDGNGLGLYIVKSVMEALGGKIWFTSEENKGTTFTFTLPIEGSSRKDGFKALT